MIYVLNHDYKYFLRKRKIILILIVVVPFLMALLYGGKQMDIVTGTNIDTNAYIPIELIVYLLNIIAFIFIIADVFIKDLKYQLDNIFLRINPDVWYFKKIIASIIFVLIIKIFEYGILFTTTASLGSNFSASSLLSIFIADVLYIVFIQNLFLLNYMIFIFLKNAKIIMIVLSIFSVILLPKNIYSTLDYWNIIVLMILIIIVATCLIFKYKSKKIIQYVGGL